MLCFFIYLFFYYHHLHGMEHAVKGQGGRQDTLQLKTLHTGHHHTQDQPVLL